MPAYVIAQPKVLDPGHLTRYLQQSIPTIAAHGGRYLVNDAHPQALEGNWDPERRLVIVEFPTRAAADAWYRSPEYAPALAIRPAALQRTLLLAEGQ